MKRYVLGFLFHENKSSVVLIRKQKPEWQFGRLNGIGGKIEMAETPEEAMARECKEECGVDVSTWERFAELNGEGFIVHCFKAFNSEAVKHAATQEREAIEKHDPDVLIEKNCVSNLHWLIPMALDDNDGRPFYAAVIYPPK